MGDIVPMAPQDELEEKLGEALTQENLAMKCEIELEAGPCGKDSFHRCPKCQKAFCGEHTSNVDFCCCSSCCEDVGVQISVVSKSEEEYDELRDETKLTSYEAKHIVFTGQHWLNNQAMIYAMSDEKLKSAIIHWKQMVKMMEEEQLRRKIDKSKKAIAAAPIFKLRNRKKADDEVVTSVSVEKRTTTRKQKKPQAPEDALQTLISAGKIDPAKLMQLLQEKLAKKNLGIPDKPANKVG